MEKVRCCAFYLAKAPENPALQGGDMTLWLMPEKKMAFWQDYLNITQMRWYENPFSAIAEGIHGKIGAGSGT
ncbi:MAG: hypothetical protein LBU79_08210 [Planctomycetota bacterium]|nr:hypothetical protein [Planctomycetota bacterium]